MRIIKPLTLAALLLASLSPHAQANRPDIRVMGYNIMQLPVQDWDQDARADHLADALRTLPALPDVIGYSEVFTDYAYSKVTGMHEYNYATPVLGLTCSGGGWNSISGPCSSMIGVVRGGVTVVSQYPILEQHALVFANYVPNSWDAQSNKGAVYAKIEMGGYNYHVVATHLQATHDETDDTEHGVRMAQLQEIHDWLDSFNIPADEPIILAGDMNVPFSLSSQVSEMLSVSEGAMNFPNNDGFGSYPENNWMSRAYNYYWGYDMCYDDTLDYVFHRDDHLQPVTTPEMDVIALKSLNSWYWSYLYGNWPLCGGSTWHNGYTTDISDHYPVMATYRYPEDNNPAPVDSDNDGLTDDEEALLGTNPAVADSDNDGLDDGAEVNTHSTDPLNADTDGDGYSDGDEVTAGSNPLDGNDPASAVQQVSGSWASSGGKSTTSSGNPHYQLTLGQSGTVTLDLTSSVDNYLYLLDSNGVILAEDNNSGGNKNARITVSLAAGNYDVVAATSRPNKSGGFTLSVSQGSLSAL